jgi:hypothetical protein
VIRVLRATTGTVRLAFVRMRSSVRHPPPTPRDSGSRCQGAPAANPTHPARPAARTSAMPQVPSRRITAGYDWSHPGTAPCWRQLLVCPVTWRPPPRWLTGPSRPALRPLLSPFPLPRSPTPSPTPSPSIHLLTPASRTGAAPRKSAPRWFHLVWPVCRPPSWRAAGDAWLVTPAAVAGSFAPDCCVAGISTQ